MIPSKKSSCFKLPGGNLSFGAASKKGLKPNFFCFSAFFLAVAEFLWQLIIFIFFFLSPNQKDGNQQRYLRGSRDHEGVRAARDNPRDIYRERKTDNARENYSHRERDRDRDRDGSREKRERDRENSRSSYYREREGDTDGKRKRERDSERSRDRGGERYKDRDRYADGETSRSKERHRHREKRKDTKKTSDEKKENSDHKYEQEEGEVE